MFNKTKNSYFFKSVSTIAGGVAFAQVIPLLATPILTRIYTPDNFGTYAAVVSVLSIFSVIGCLRYELAIPLSRKVSEGMHVAVLGMCIALLLTLCMLSIIISFDITKLVDYLRFGIGEFLIYIPILFFLRSIMLVLNYVAIRERVYSVISISKVYQTVTQVASKLLFGILGLGAFGLVWGLFAGVCVGVIVYFFYLHTVKNNNRIFFKEIMVAAKKYKNFPIYMAPSSLINTISSYFPQLFIVSLYGSNIGGNYFLAHSIIGLPLTVLSSSVSQVYYAEASKLITSNPLKLLKIYLAISKSLLLIGIIICIILFTVGESGFALVFGESWRDAGHYVGLLSIMFIARLVTSSIANSLNILGKQKKTLLIHIAIFTGTITSILVASTFFEDNVSMVILVYSSIVGLIYFFSYLYITQVVKKAVYTAAKDVTTLP